MAEKAYLIGQGIAHSLSPPIYTAAFDAMDLDVVYELLDVEKHELAKAEAAIRAPGCVGANVTMPHKFWAARAADEVDSVARACGAANLLALEAGRLLGRNTDAEAIASLLAEREAAVSAGRALLVGAGGAAVAGLWALSRVTPAGIVVSARRTEATDEMAALAHVLVPGVRVETALLDELDGRQAGITLILNATPAGMHDQREDPLPSFPIETGNLVYDLVYRREGATALQARALAAGAELVDGAGHLLEQAFPAFEAFTGTAAPREAMRRAVVDVLGREPARWSRA